MKLLSAALSSKLQPGFKTSFVLSFVLAFFSITNVWAQKQNIYISQNDGFWINASVWDIAPPYNVAQNRSTLNNGDKVYIKHAVTTDDIKINNGGIIYILNDSKTKGVLTGKFLDMNGPNSLIVIGPGSVLNFKNLAYDNSNGKDSVEISKGDLNPLPVTLVYFDVKRKAQTANNTTLEWITASEKNNAYFAVEKSLDGKTFTEAGRVAGKNSVSGGKYAFEDKNVSARAYYRLKQVDLDGTFTYSAIVVTNAELKMAVHGRNVIFGKDFTGKLNLLNISGRVVNSVELTKAGSFDLPEMLQGVFILQLESNGQVTTQRIVL